MLDVEFNTIEEGIEKLKKAVSVRDTMGGALYWNVCNDDCVKMAGELIKKGTNPNEVRKIIA